MPETNYSAGQRRGLFCLFATLIPVLCGLLLVLPLDFLFGRSYLDAAVRRAVAAEREYRIANPDYHHTLRPGFSTDKAVWGDRRYSIRTNSLGFKDAPCYGPKGVDDSIRSALHDMTGLANLLKKNGKSFSVGVYPWPDQLAFDVVESLQVRIWRKWCEDNGCHLFINHFPDMFDRKGSRLYPSELFLEGDVHFNTLGNTVIAARLLREFAEH